MKYAKSTQGFYTEEIHGSNIPADAVEISDELYHSLLEGQSAGKVIAADKDGVPYLADRPKPTAEQLLEMDKAAARAYLADTDWYYARLAETGKEVPAAVIKKRKSSRELLNK